MKLTDRETFGRLSDIAKRYHRELSKWDNLQSNGKGIQQDKPSRILELRYGLEVIHAIMVGIKKRIEP